MGNSSTARIKEDGAVIESQDSGMLIIIPEKALKDQELNLLVNPCLNGPFELPPDYKLASPVYLIHPEKRVKFDKDVIVRIRHHSKITSTNECKDMTFLSASVIPKYKGDKPVYNFKEMKHGGIFKPNSEVGEISIRHFCFLCIGRLFCHREGIFTHNS